MAKVFFSYSHKDESYRNELEVHLSQLKRENAISTWHDRRINPGDEFERVIDSELASSDIVLLLVSPYFLASEYCNEVELKKALELNNQGATRVVPVILEPCDWQYSIFGKLLALPTDGKPISKHTNVHDGYLDVVQRIREMIPSISKSPSEENSDLQTGFESESYKKPDRDNHQTHKEQQTRSSNLRIRKPVDDHDKEEFRIEAFEFIANYFESSLSELQKRNPDIKNRFRRIDANTFTAFSYLDNERRTECRITLSSPFGGIAYSSNANSSDNSANDWLEIGHDGYVFTLSSPISGSTHSTDGAFSMEGAAEYFWSTFIHSMQ